MNVEASLFIRCTFALFLLFCVHIEETSSVSLKQIVVPTPVFAGDDLRISCETGMAISEIYSLKWFKDEEEFYRFIPKEIPTTKSYFTPGVNVNIENSYEGSVLINDVTMTTAGVYKCEVSGESPLFRTKAMTKDLEVFIMPENKPRISGEREKYRINDAVDLNCTSGFSYPSAKLTWFINGATIPSDYVRKYRHWKNQAGLIKTKSRLNFVVDKTHFDSNGLMTVTCKAIIGDHYSDKATHNIAHEIFAAGDSQIRYHSIEESQEFLSSYKENGSVQAITEPKNYRGKNNASCMTGNDIVLIGLLYFIRITII